MPRTRDPLACLRRPSTDYGVTRVATTAADIPGLHVADDRSVPESCRRSAPDRVSVWKARIYTETCLAGGLGLGAVRADNGDDIAELNRPRRARNRGVGVGTRSESGSNRMAGQWPRHLDRPALARVRQEVRDRCAQSERAC